MDTFTRVRKVFLQKFDIAEEKLTPTASLEGLGLDSLDSLEVLFDLEDEFQVRIPQDRVSEMKLSTVQDIVDSMNALISAQHVKPDIGQSAV